jgi:hypothetical protein
MAEQRAVRQLLTDFPFNHDFFQALHPWTVAHSEQFLSPPSLFPRLGPRILEYDQFEDLLR